MPSSAQRLAASAPVPEPVNETEIDRATAEADADHETKVVPLFVDQVVLAEPSRRDEAGRIDWPAAIEHIRDVGARVREARDFAQEVSRHSQVIIQRSLKQTEDAEQRARAAEALAAAAAARADKAEELARLSEARARLAEKQAEAAKAAETEAQLWLRRVHACLKDEFTDLVTDLA